MTIGEEGDPPHDRVEQAAADYSIDYVKWQVEQGSGGDEAQSGTCTRGRHLQMILYRASACRKTLISKFLRIVQPHGDLSKTASGPVDPVNEGVEKMLNYVWKDAHGMETADRHEFGQAPQNGPAKKMASSEAVRKILDNIQTVGVEQAEKEFLETATSTYQWTEAMKLNRRMKALNMKQRLREKLEEMNLKPWQQTLTTALTGEPHDRHVYVVLDKRGSCGKTTFYKRWAAMKETDQVAQVSNGKTADIMHIMSQKPDARWVFINLTRSTMQVVNYQAIEQIKDGSYMSGKYEGCEVTGMPPHLVIFTNFALDWKSMSEDRWRIGVVNNMHMKWQTLEEYINGGGEWGYNKDATENPNRNVLEHYTPPEQLPGPSGLQKRCETRFKRVEREKRANKENEEPQAKRARKDTTERWDDAMKIARAETQPVTKSQEKEMQWENQQGVWENQERVETVDISEETPWGIPESQLETEWEPLEIPTHMLNDLP